MNGPDTKSRKDRIFEFLVTAYIQLGAPVGSVTLCKHSHIDLSPATIRNIMKELEDLGYISQPHTSAGRIPTDKGYRYYVDRIMEVENISLAEQENIKSICSISKAQPEILLENILKSLSEITSQASLVLFPKIKKNLLEQIRLVLLNNNKAIAILTTTSGLIKTKDFEIAKDIDDAYLGRISGFINNNCANKPLNQIEDILSAILLSAANPIYYICKDALDILEKIDIENESDKLFLDGTHYLFEQPEFEDVARYKRLLKAFEEKTSLLNFVEENIRDEGVKICIGKENPCLQMQDCSIVISSYGVDDNTLGAVGVIGPTRMSYKRVVPVVNCMAEQVSCVFETL